MKKRKICVSRVLKMTSLFFLSCAMCAQAETVSSQSIRITLNKNNVRLENILNDIESQTNLLFIYNKNVNVNRKVSVNAQNTSLQEVLQNLFDNNVSFKIEGSYIVLSLTGRDKGELMLVVAEEGDFLLLANGRARRAENPKRKRRKHVSLQGPCDERTRLKLQSESRLTNSEIRKALALWTGDEDNI